jgi:hypothetical protein
MNQPSLVEACKLLEGRSSIELLRVVHRLDGQTIKIGVDFDVNGWRWKWKRFSDESFDVDVWRRLGRAARNITLHELEFWRLDTHDR